MTTRYVLYSETEGVYLGSCLGFGFWSKCDPAGQTAAVTFESTAQARAVSTTWDQQLPNLKVVAVEADIQNYASIEACVVAGIDRWIP